MRSVAMPPIGRLPALDYVKAAAIISVTVTHAVPGFFDGTITPAALTVMRLVGFHVPAFLMVSGFLARAESPVGWRHVADRLSRILPPYVVATAVVWICGLVAIPTVRKLVFTLVTGSAFGHYYFIPILAFCFLLLPLLSRLDDAQLTALAVGLALVSGAMWLEPRWRLTQDFFWGVREPLVQFHVGDFVLGMLASRHRAALRDLLSRQAVPIALAAVVVILANAWFVTIHPTAANALLRAAYTVAIIALLAALVPPRPAPAAVRFLSDATLTIYLYHWFACDRVAPLVGVWPLPVQLILLPILGIGFGALVAVGSRALFGKWSRQIVGY